MERNTAPFLTLGSFAALGLLISGCADINQRNRLGNAVDLPALDGPEVGTAYPEPEQAWTGPGQRTTRVDRGAWAPVEFLVPYDGTVAGPSYAGWPVLASETRRQQNLYPTPESALDLNGTNHGTQVFEGPVAVASALADTALIPVRLIIEPLWIRKTAPAVLYKRTEQSENWSPGPIEGGE